MKDKILEAVQISKTYGEGESAVQALKASDLTIWKGEFASIIGSSGSGKSWEDCCRPRPETFCWMGRTSMR